MGTTASGAGAQPRNGVGEPDTKEMEQRDEGRSKARAGSESGRAWAASLRPQAPGKAAAEARREADLRVLRLRIPACCHVSPGPDHPPRDGTRVAKALRLLRHRGASGIGDAPGARFSHADSRCRATRSPGAGGEERAPGTGSGSLPSASPAPTGASRVRVPPLYRSRPEGSPPVCWGYIQKRLKTILKQQQNSFPSTK